MKYEEKHEKKHGKMEEKKEMHKKGIKKALAKVEATRVTAQDKINANRKNDKKYFEDDSYSERFNKE